jgi:hypothetical protein
MKGVMYLCWSEPDVLAVEQIVIFLTRMATCNLPETGAPQFSATGAFGPGFWQS